MDFCSDTDLKPFHQSKSHHPTKSDFPEQPALPLRNFHTPPETHLCETMTFAFPAEIPSQFHPAPETPHLPHLLSDPATPPAPTLYDLSLPHLPAQTLPAPPSAQ